MTYGLGRAEILSAQVNGATLLVLGLLIVYEGVHRLVDPPDVDGGAGARRSAIAGIGGQPRRRLGVLARANRASLNVEGAFQHILTDLYAFIGTAIAAVVILATGFDRADAIASLLSPRSCCARPTGC